MITRRVRKIVVAYDGLIFSGRILEILVKEHAKIGESKENFAS